MLNVNCNYLNLKNWLQKLIIINYYLKSKEIIYILKNIELNFLRLCENQKWDIKMRSFLLTWNEESITVDIACKSETVQKLKIKWAKLHLIVKTMMAIWCVCAFSLVFCTIMYGWSWHLSNIPPSSFIFY